jgi:hypothetical protein
MIDGTQPRGRPLRFLLILLLCWSGGRLALTIDGDAMGLLLSRRAAVTLAQASPRSALAPRPAPAVPARASVKARAATRAPPLAVRLHPGQATPAPMPHGLAGAPGIEANPMAPFPTVAAYEGRPAPPLAAFPPGQGFGMPDPRPAPDDGGKWLLSGWTLWRPGSDAAASGPGRLGASQTGMRIDRRLDIGLPPAMRLSAYGRVSGAMVRPAAPEAALGIALQPDRRLQLTVGVERRIALGDGAHDAMAVAAASGIGPVALPASLRLDGYAQAGMVGVHARDAFADGRASLLHPLGGERMAVGLSLSGGAQPRLARLDIGPELRIDLPVGGGLARVDAGWRQRIAGEARPGSGPVVTIGTAF